MKNRAALAITVLVIGLVLAVVIVLRPERSATGGPEQAITDMLTASRQGEAQRYFDCFGGRLRETTERSAEDMSAAGFREYLREQGRAIKGYAVTEREERGSKARLRVEFVYEDRNEVQWVTLERERARWKIIRLTPAERVEPPVPYGTKVTPLPQPGTEEEQQPSEQP